MKEKEIYRVLYGNFKSSPRKWRTAKSVARETGLPLDDVLDFLESSDFVRAKKGNQSGESLYSLSSTATEVNLRSQNYRSIIISSLDSAGDRVSSAIHRALMDLGVQITKLDKTSSSAVLINNIIDAIRTSDFIVVDITRHNPNVYYELGYAHALRKPTILLISADSSSSLPSDLSGSKYIVYDKDNLTPLVEQVKRAALGYLNKKEDTL